jgi:hypothetical protein
MIVRALERGVVQIECGDVEDRGLQGSIHKGGGLVR